MRIPLNMVDRRPGALRVLIAAGWVVFGILICAGAAQAAPVWCENTPKHDSKYKNYVGRASAATLDQAYREAEIQVRKEAVEENFGFQFQVQSVGNMQSHSESTSDKRIPYYPASGFEKLAENRGDMQFWELHEARAFLVFAGRKYPPGSENRWKYAVYLLALNTALRAGEIWGLKPSDIMQDGQTIYVKRQWDLVAQDFRLPKGKKYRHVPCNDVLSKELQSLVERREATSDRTLFHARTGTPICHDNFGDGFRADLKESGLKALRFHDLRHTATTLMIADGLDIKTVKEICGHKDISTTMNYVHLLGDSIRNAAKTFAVAPVSSNPSPKSD